MTYLYGLLMLQNVREQLEESLPGTGGGRNSNETLLVQFLFLLPILTWIFLYYKSFLQVLYVLAFMSNAICFCEEFVSIVIFVQTRSLCDHLRQLYFKFRSGGALAYTTVSSSSTTSNKEVSFPSIFC